jgi:hypothetical protein
LGCCQKPILPATVWRWYHALGEICLIGYPGFLFSEINQ